GCHPSYTPLIANLAPRYAGPSGKPVRMLAITSFYPTQEAWESLVRKHPYAHVVPIAALHTPLDEALENLAVSLSEHSQALITVGGREGRYSLRTNKQQVEDELDKARKRNHPVYLLGGCGGLSRKLFEDRFKQKPSGLDNGLEDEENLQLENAS